MCVSEKGDARGRGRGVHGWMDVWNVAEER